MFPLIRKNLLFHSSRYSSNSSSSSQLHTFLFRFPSLGFSSPPPPPPPPPPQRDSRHPMVSVWWDVDSCGVPAGISYWNVAPSIVSAVRANGIKGPVDIWAYSRFSKISEVDRLTLLSTGIAPLTVETDHNCLTARLENWVARNPPPVHLFLISGDRCDRDFLGMLQRLRMNNYNILIACPGGGSDILRSLATIMWQWSLMLKGEDLTGKYLNYPPYGPFDSRYGDSKVPLENPFSAAEEEPTENAEIFLKSGEVSKVTIENPFFEEPTSSKKQGGSGS